MQQSALRSLSILDYMHDDLVAQRYVLMTSRTRLQVKQTKAAVI